MACGGESGMDAWPSGGACPGRDDATSEARICPWDYPVGPTTVRTSNNSGKNVRSSACFRKPTPLEPPVPGRKPRSEEHTSELQSLMRISYAVFCLKKKNTKQTNMPAHKQT